MLLFTGFLVNSGSRAAFGDENGIDKCLLTVV